ncbi:MAG: FAD binding domain-containing protein [Elusimicrobia bacterium]|nr:FAD binding domain-containing protein [Elusimicrobiota bacterium]
MFPDLIVKPLSLKELSKTLLSLPSDRKYLAGGTDLVVRANADIENSRYWIDISGLEELRYIKETAKSVLIGSQVKASELEDSRIIKKHLPTLLSALPHFASPSLRNMATLGGNCANASPSADLACALVSEEAYIALYLKGKKRKMLLKDFFLGLRKTALRKDELIWGFEIPKISHKGAYMKLALRSSFAISKIGIALSVRINQNKVEYLSIALVSVAPKIITAPKTCDFLKNKILSPEILDKAASIIQKEVNPITDIRSDGDYRRSMAGVLLKKAFKEVLK